MNTNKINEQQTEIKKLKEINNDIKFDFDNNFIETSSLKNTNEKLISEIEN